MHSTFKSSKREYVEFAVCRMYPGNAIGPSHSFNELVGPDPPVYIAQPRRKRGKQPLCIEDGLQVSLEEALSELIDAPSYAEADVDADINAQDSVEHDLARAKRSTMDLGSCIDDDLLHLLQADFRNGVIEGTVIDNGDELIDDEAAAVDDSRALTQEEDLGVAASLAELVGNNELVQHKQRQEAQHSAARVLDVSIPIDFEAKALMLMDAQHHSLACWSEQAASATSPLPTNGNLSLVLLPHHDLQVTLVEWWVADELFGRMVRNDPDGGIITACPGFFEDERLQHFPGCVVIYPDCGVKHRRAVRGQRPLLPPTPLRLKQQLAAALTVSGEFDICCICLRGMSSNTNKARRCGLCLLNVHTACGIELATYLAEHKPAHVPSYSGVKLPQAYSSGYFCTTCLLLIRSIG